MQALPRGLKREGSNRPAPAPGFCTMLSPWKRRNKLSSESKSLRRCVGITGEQPNKVWLTEGDAGQDMAPFYLYLPAERGSLGGWLTGLPVSQLHVPGVFYLVRHRAQVRNTCLATPIVERLGVFGPSQCLIFPAHPLNGPALLLSSVTSCRNEGRAEQEKHQNSSSAEPNLAYRLPHTLSAGDVWSCTYYLPR
mgnify:CR=1 FL=1